MLNKTYQLRGYFVEPISLIEIRERAINSREVLSLQNTPIDMGIFLENLIKFGITIDVIDDSDAPSFLTHTEACCIPETNIIYLTSSTYLKACNNDPRTRFTIFHELGHIILKHSRYFHRDQDIRKIEPKAFLDSEWQADQFAAEILMPLNLIRSGKLRTPSLIMESFGVSESAAIRRYNQLKKRNEI